jgi:protein-disulfide isomerase
MSLSRVFLLIFCMALCVAQNGWQTATTLPGVDLSPLTKAQRDVALAVLRKEGCACGCDMKIAECRVGDPGCGVSRRLAAFVVKEASEGKKIEAIRADVVKYAAEPAPLLDDQAVKISIAGDPMRGPSNAKVTIVEFSDFQCPFCAAAVTQVNEVLKKYPKDVRLVYKQFPLDTHSQAALAAEAALAAQAQDKFWEMHDKMYANFKSISRDKIFVWAKEIGLDTNKLRADLDAHKYAARVAAETKEGEDAGVEGTPTFFIDGRKFNSTFQADLVGPLVEKQLKR